MPYICPDREDYGMKRIKPEETCLHKRIVYAKMEKSENIEKTLRKKRRKFYDGISSA